MNCLTRSEDFLFKKDIVGYPTFSLVCHFFSLIALRKGGESMTSTYT